MTPRRLTLISCAAAATLSACTVGPNYRRPEAPLPPAAGFSDLAGKPQGAVLSATTSADVTPGAWWAQFHDPELDSLIARALRDNLTLAQAASRIRQARAQEVVAAAAGLPQLTATGNVLRDNRNSDADSPLGGLIGASSAAGGATGGGSGAASGASAGGSAAGSGASSSGQGPSHINYFTVGLDAIWEVDVFGGVRRGVEAAKDSTAAAVWNRRDSQVSVAAEVANQYLQLRLAQSRLQVLTAQLQEQEGVLKIVRDRFATGLVTDLDVNQQRAQLASTQAQIPQVQAQAIAAIHALGVLVAQPPETLEPELSTARPLPPVPPSIPAGLPSQLLRRRPDIRASERQLAAANAQIGVQTAALYPNLNLVGLGSFGSNAIERVFEGRNAMSIGLALAQWNVFTAGRNQANVRIAREQYRQQLYSYQTTVLQALQEVEDALARYAADQHRWSSLQGAFTASQSAFRIASQQYAVGLVDYTSVYNAQATLLQVQDQLTQADGALATDATALYKALGGGWTVDPTTDGKVGADYPVDRGARRAG